MKHVTRLHLVFLSSFGEWFTEGRRSLDGDHEALAHQHVEKHDFEPLPKRLAPALAAGALGITGADRSRMPPVRNEDFFNRDQFRLPPSRPHFAQDRLASVEPQRNPYVDRINEHERQKHGQDLVQQGHCNNRHDCGAAHPFKIGGEFKFSGLPMGGLIWGANGDQAEIRRATRVSDGLRVIMKRPKYNDRLWEDDLSLEKYTLDFLNEAGVPGIVECVGEALLAPEDVMDIEIFGKPAMEAGGHDGHGHWHVIYTKEEDGQMIGVKSDEPQNIAELYTNRYSVDSPDMKAVKNMFDITWKMLQAGVVNADQYHNIIFKPDGRVIFIDFESARFINTKPMEALGKNGVKEIIGKKRLHVRAGEYEIRDHVVPPVLSPEEAALQVGNMIGSLLRI